MKESSRRPQPNWTGLRLRAELATLTVWSLHRLLSMTIAFAIGNCSGAPEKDNYEIREKRENGERKRIFGRPMFTNLNLFRVISRVL